MTKNEKYVRENLIAELEKVQEFIFSKEFDSLTIFEKAIIYKYTDGGYSVNEQLRSSQLKNENQKEYVELLSKTLRKLKSYRGLVYRGVNLTVKDLMKYRTAFIDEIEVIYSAFTSSTKDPYIASLFGNTFITIISKRGKDIQELSAFGVFTGENEFEVLFDRNTKFRILDIRTANDKTFINMEEI